MPRSDTVENLAVRRVTWIALLTAAAIAGSFIFACAAPFAALAALGALNLERRDAFGLTGLVWAINQTIGYGLLGYPQTRDSLGWGLAIGGGALIATWAALGAERLTHSAGRIVSAMAAFACAFVFYESALYAATIVLPASDETFGVAVILYILKVNVVALGGLFILQALGLGFGLAVPRRIGAGAPA